MIAEGKMNLSRVAMSRYKSIIDSIMCDGKSIERPSMRERKETSMRLGDSVIVRPWSEYKGYHHIKDLWTFSKLSCGEI